MLQPAHSEQIFHVLRFPKARLSISNSENIARPRFPHHWWHFSDFYGLFWASHFKTLWWILCVSFHFLSLWNALLFSNSASELPVTLIFRSVDRSQPSPCRSVGNSQLRPHLSIGLWVEGVIFLSIHGPWVCVEWLQADSWLTRELTQSNRRGPFSFSLIFFDMLVVSVFHFM